MCFEQGMKRKLDIIFICIILLLNSANSKIIIADSLIRNKVASCRIPLYYYHGSASYIKEFGMKKKGSYHSKKTKDKISKTMTGRKLSKEHCNKLSKRKITWGDKISKAMIGRTLSQEHCDNISKAQIGRKLSQEWKDNISKANKGNKKLIDAMTGKKYPQERCDNISKGRKGIKFSQEHCDNISKAHKGGKHSQEHCNNLSKALMKDFEDVTYNRKHRKLEKQYGKANHCELNKNHKSKQFDWTNINHRYNKNIDEWLPLCHKCHMSFDRGNIDIEILKKAIRNRRKLEPLV